MAGFLPNEEVKAIDLLYGALLPSGADTAAALADKFSGSQNHNTEQYDVEDAKKIYSTYLV